MDNQLTKAEEQVMQILWQIKRGFVKDIISQIPDPKPPYNTISSVVRILVQKGFVSFKAYGKTHEYFPLVSKQTYGKTAFKSFIHKYYEGSFKNLISAFSDEPDLDIQELTQLIEELKKGES